MTFLRSFIDQILVWIKAYFRENWGAPFILSFLVLLLAAVGFLIAGLPWSAEAVGDVAYFSLVVGVVLQLVCLLRKSSVKKEEVKEAE